jgi:hypothetical protein
VGNAAGLFIGVERRFVGRYFELAELQWSAMVVREKSRRGLRPAGFAVDSVLWDATRRAGALAVAAGEGVWRRGAVVLEVTGRAKLL